MKTMNQAEKLAVLDQAFARESAKENPPAVRALLDGWRDWYASLTWYDRAVSPKTADEAGKRFLELKEALGTTPVIVGDAMPLPLIGKGSRGAAVRRLKQALGLTPVNGNFDGATEAALKEWQAQHGIDSTGKAGPETWAALNVRSIRSTAPASSPEAAQQSAFGVEQMQQSFFSVGQGDVVTSKYGVGTVGRGSKGQQVAAWQTIIGVKADGDFGPATEAATKKWQTAHGLTADGVAGPQSWAAASSIVTPVVAAKLAVEAAKEKPFNVDLGDADVPGFAPAPPPPVPAVIPGVTKPIIKLAPQPIQEAGMFSGLANLSTPAKVALGVATAGALAFGIDADMKKKGGPGLFGKKR
jgi:peptidoglycan hydrolase-like protein with peptidoglycan-binding domain